MQRFSSRQVNTFRERLVTLKIYSVHKHIDHTWTVRTLRSALALTISKHDRKIFGSPSASATLAEHMR